MNSQRSDTRRRRGRRGRRSPCKLVRQTVKAICFTHLSLPQLLLLAAITGIRLWLPVLVSSRLAANKLCSTAAARRR